MQLRVPALLESSVVVSAEARRETSSDQNGSNEPAGQHDLKAPTTWPEVNLWAANSAVHTRSTGLQTTLEALSQ